MMDDEPTVWSAAEAAELGNAYDGDGDGRFSEKSVYLPTFDSIHYSHNKSELDRPNT